MTSMFTDAHDFVVNELNVKIDAAPAAGDALQDLASRIAAGALHDSDERCDAPKCHPETRVAVQEEIYSWIVHGDLLGDSELAQEALPRKIKWVTGPAGTGKTAIMGSVADTCKQNGVPAVTFFFSSFASPDRRRKTVFIPTLAYQLTEHLPQLKDPIAQAIRDKPLLFRKNLRVQMEALILTPLRQVKTDSNMLGVVLIDGLDECEAEQYFDGQGSLRAPDSIERTKDEDQLEILQVLQEAAAELAFPFRIVIASRPERVFREFFSNKKFAPSFAPPLILDEKYNPEADIILFLQSKFDEIRRRYNLSPSWPSPEHFATLLDQSSGQFIYAATVIRYITTSRHGNPHTLLEQVLEVKPAEISVTNPFAQLDAFYTHILESSSNPTLSVKWLWMINGELPGGWYPFPHAFPGSAPAFVLNSLLQTNPGDSEYVLGGLHSLISVPMSSDDLETPYRPYHKTLYDYLSNEDRCGPLYVDHESCHKFLCGRFLEICTHNGSPTCNPAHQDRFLQTFFYLEIPYASWFLPQFELAPSAIDWWVSGCANRQSGSTISLMFFGIHQEVDYDYQPPSE